MQKFDAGLHERLVGVPFPQIEFGSKFMAVPVLYAFQIPTVLNLIPNCLNLPPCKKHIHLRAAWTRCRFACPCENQEVRAMDCRHHMVQCI